VREALLDFFLAVKGESVLASINCFERMRRLAASPDSAAKRQAVRSLSGLLNAIMALNIVEAVVANLSFARWPENARAGVALLLTQSGHFREDLSQDLSYDWFALYLVWNACFVWPAHAPDMMCFAMLLTPSIACGSPSLFQYNRAHSLFWVVRATQLTKRQHYASTAETRQPAQWIRADGATPQDRQPLTTRMSKLTGAQGEQLAARAGVDISGSRVWYRFVVEILPTQLASFLQVYRAMPKGSSFGKLRLLTEEMP